jgi:hypothetical protein
MIQIRFDGRRPAPSSQPGTSGLPCDHQYRLVAEVLTGSRAWHRLGFDIGSAAER